MYKLNGDGTKWDQIGNDIDGDSGGDGVGTSVSLSGNGKIVVMGAPTAGYDNEIRTGQVKVYRIRIDAAGSSWEPLGESIYGDYGHDLFGTSVDISHDGNTIVIGAPTITLIILTQDTCESFLSMVATIFIPVLGRRSVKISQEKRSTINLEFCFYLPMMAGPSRLALPLIMGKMEMMQVTPGSIGCMIPGCTLAKTSKEKDMMIFQDGQCLSLGMTIQWQLALLVFRMTKEAIMVW
jgi:hypothetical protein